MNLDNVEMNLDNVENLLQASKKVARHFSISKKFHYAFSNSVHSTPWRTYIHDLQAHEIHDIDSRDFKEFYSLYSTIFPLKEERESIDSYERLFKIDTVQNLQNQSGPYREVTMAMRDPQTGEVIGGVDFFVVAAGNQSVDGADGCAHISYLFVKETHRSLGVGTSLLKDAEAYCNNFVAQALQGDARLQGQPKLYMFCEQNAPLKMTPENYLVDTLGAKIDQFDRLHWWQDKAQFRRLDFNYTQPPLDLDGETYHGLILNAKVPDGMAVTPAILTWYLRRYFSISVLKGAEIEGNSDFDSMIADIRSHRTIRLMDDRASLPALKKMVYGVLDRLSATGTLTQTRETLGELVGSARENRPSPGGHTPNLSTASILASSMSARSSF